jgi:multiple sugar transport system substrate-binding protein
MDDKKKKQQRVSRRDFMKIASTGSLAAGMGTTFLFPERAAAQQKTLKILQWSHFVPAWDKWFNETYTKEWGQKNNTNVIVDNINLVDLNARAASEAQAQKGHDLFMLLSPPAKYESQVLDMTHVYQEVEKKWGKKIDLAHKSTYNPKTKRYFAFSDAYTPDPGNYRRDLWSEVGFPNGPDSYDDLLKGAKAIKAKVGMPCGLGLSQELDTSMAMRALLWSFGGAEQDEAGNVTINSKQTIEALKFMKELYQQTETPEVFTWTPPSNNQTFLAGKVSYVANAISISRQSERENMPIDKNIGICKAPRGPVRRIAAEHVMNCYMIWNFAENKEGAQKFLIDYMDHFHDGFIAGQFYNFPCFPKTCPNLQKEIANDPRSHPPDRYKVLGDVLTWATNVGYPGYATAAIDQAFNSWVIPTMFATVAQGKASPEDAAKTAEAEYKRIFERMK